MADLLGSESSHDEGKLIEERKVESGSCNLWRHDATSFASLLLPSNLYISFHLYNFLGFYNAFTTSHRIQLGICLGGSLLSASQKLTGYGSGHGSRTVPGMALDSRNGNNTAWSIGSLQKHA